MAESAADGGGGGGNSTKDGNGGGGGGGGGSAFAETSATNVSYVSAGGTTGNGQVVIAWGASALATTALHGGALSIEKPIRQSWEDVPLHSTCTGS